VKKRYSFLFGRGGVGKKGGNQTVPLGDLQKTRGQKNHPSFKEVAGRKTRTHGYRRFHRTGNKKGGKTPGNQGGGGGLFLFLKKSCAKSGSLRFGGKQKPNQGRGKGEKQIEVCHTFPGDGGGGGEKKGKHPQILWVQ